MDGVFSKRGSRAERRFQGFILTVWLSLCVEPTSCQGSYDAAVGATVTLSAPVTGNFFSCAWYRGSLVNDDQRILTYVPASSPPQSNGPQYNGRETGLSTGALQIRDVRTTDNGSYIVSMTLNNGNPATATIKLTVYDNSAPDNSASDWKIAVGVTVGVLLFAALIATGVVLWYKRRTRTLKGENTHENPVMVQDPDPHYENVRKGNPGPSANQTTDADSAYMALTHKDQATYDQLKRSKT